MKSVSYLSAEDTSAPPADSDCEPADVRRQRVDFSLEETDLLRSDVGNLRSQSPLEGTTTGLRQGELTPDHNTMPTPTSLSKVLN